MTVAEKHRRSKKGAQHGARRRPRPRAITVGRDQFRFTLERGPTLPSILVDDLVESASWEEQPGVSPGGATLSVLAGEVVFRSPEAKRVDVQQGHRLLCEWNSGQGSWYPLWRMRIIQPSVDLGNGSYTYVTGSDLSLLSAFIDDWSYRRSKHKPRGWTGDEIILDVLKRVGLKPGVIPKLKKRHTKLIRRNTDAASVLMAVLKAEHFELGTRWTISGYGGRVNVTPLFRRNTDMLVLSDLITAATLQLAMIDGATALAVHATTGTGRKKKKVAFTVRSPAAEYRFGFIKKPYPVLASSKAEARKIAKRALAKMAVPKLTLDLTHVGIPSVRAGDRLSLEIARDDLGTDINHKFVYLAGVSHQVSSAGYTMDLTLAFEDPVTALDQADARSKQARDDAARKRKRQASTKAAVKPKSKKAAQRK